MAGRLINGREGPNWRAGWRRVARSVAHGPGGAREGRARRGGVVVNFAHARMDHGWMETMTVLFDPEAEAERALHPPNHGLPPLSHLPFAHPHRPSRVDGGRWRPRGSWSWR